MNFTVGTRVRVLHDRARSAQVLAGDLGTVIGTNPEYCDVKMDVSRHDGVTTWGFCDGDLEAFDGVEPEAETLESFRLSFLTGAVARGEANGETHSAQVKDALDDLARLEFLEPSTTLEGFQKRIVRLAMEAKGKHSWCGEPEAFLTEIGLKHLLPVRRYVKVITEVLVSGEGDWSDSRFAEQATVMAAAQTNAYSFWTVNSE